MAFWVDSKKFPSIFYSFQIKFNLGVEGEGGLGGIIKILILSLNFLTTQKDRKLKFELWLF